MNQKQTIKDFKQFMKSRRAWSKWVRNYTIWMRNFSLNEPCSSFLDRNEMKPMNFTGSAFLWDISPEGFAFWSDLDLQWFNSLAELEKSKQKQS